MVKWFDVPCCLCQTVYKTSKVYPNMVCLSCQFSPTYREDYAKVVDSTRLPPGCVNPEKAKELSDALSDHFSKRMK